MKVEKRTREFTSTWRPPKEVRCALRRGERKVREFLRPPAPVAADPEAHTAPERQPEARREDSPG